MAMAMQTECRIHVPPNRKTCITSTTYRFRGLRKIVSQVVIIEMVCCVCVNFVLVVLILLYFVQCDFMRLLLRLFVDYL